MLCALSRLTGVCVDVIGHHISGEKLRVVWDVYVALSRAMVLPEGDAVEGGRLRCEMCPRLTVEDLRSFLLIFHEIF